MNQFSKDYLEQKGWLWSSSSSREPGAAMMQDGLYIFGPHGEDIRIPREKMEGFFFWIASHPEWLSSESPYTYTAGFDPAGTDFYAREARRAEHLSCSYCMNNLPHTAEEHEQMSQIHELTVFEDPIDPLDAPMDGQW